MRRRRRAEHVFPVVISAPSGGGKSAIKSEIFKSDGRFAFSVTCTTRKRRKGEREGRDYFFLSKKKFAAMARSGKLLEWAEVHGNLYGTPVESVKKILEKNRVPLMTIDVNGARSVKKIFPGSVSVFILPPSLEILLERLKKREESGSETAKRLETAMREIKEARRYDYIVVNDEIENAAAKIVKIVESEFLKAERNDDKIADFEKDLNARRNSV